MLSEQQLPNVWRVWLSFSSGKKSQANYGKNLIRLYELKSWADIAYIWTQSDIKNPDYFFANPQTGEYTKFQIQNEMRKVESINFFKGDTEPTWEYGDNYKGGYYDFSLSKDISPEIVSEVFEHLVFMALGESNNLSQSILGIRVVDTSSSFKKNQRCRFEIWVSYPDSDDRLELIKQHSVQIQELLSKSEFALTKIKFSNFRDKMEMHEKKDKERTNQPDKK